MNIGKTFLAAAAALLVGVTATAADQVKIGHLPVTGHGKFFIAKDTGIFEKNGLDVELIEFINSADGLAAVRSGKLDAGSFGTTAPLVNIASGADIRIISGIMGEDAAIIIKPENAAQFKTLADLKGKRVATVRLASGDAVFRGALKAAGLDWRTDITIFELKNPPAVQEAVRTGQVDAGVTWGPHDFRAEDQGLKVFLRSRDLSAGHPCCRLVVTADSLKARRDVFVRLVKSLIEAEKFAAENHDATVAIVSKWIKLDKPLVEKAFYSGFLNQDSDPNVRGVELFWQTMNDSGFIKSDRNIRDYIVTDVYADALASLRKEHPDDPFYRNAEKLFLSRN